MNPKGSMSIFMPCAHSYAAYAAQDVNTAISLERLYRKKFGKIFLFNDFPRSSPGYPFWKTVSEDFPKSFLKAQMLFNQLPYSFVVEVNHCADISYNILIKNI
jgi:hypothetical protein